MGSPAEETWTFRVTGLGHKLTLLLSPSQTTADLQDHIAEATGVPALYQRILTPRGCPNQDEWPESGSSLRDAGLSDRTKLTVLHGPLYARDKDGLEALTKIAAEMEELESKNLEKTVLSEMVTRICIRLDAIETNGSEPLRSKRKELLQKAEKLDSSR